MPAIQDVHVRVSVSHKEFENSGKSVPLLDNVVFVELSCVSAGPSVGDASGIGKLGLLRIFPCSHNSPLF